MFVYLLQIRDSLENGHVYLFTFFVTLVWLNWLRKVQLSRRYRPYTEPVTTTISVIIPVVDEPEVLFDEVLRRIVAQEPDEVIVVINGPRNRTLEEICKRFDRVTWRWTEVPGKRNALRVGVEMALGDIAVLVDSDTIWTSNTLSELLKPFADERVGGVTSRQHILAHDRHVLTRWADWMECVRNEYSMPAMSVLGTVGCLPGRTIAFRKKVLVDAMPNFLGARFLGLFLEVSDDRTLTNEALKQGYRTVYQGTSVVYTDAPTHWRKMAKQQLRWARGSQYNTLRMLPWMLRNARTLAFFYLCDVFLPFLLLCTVTGWAFRLATSQAPNLFEGMVSRYGQGIAFVLLITSSIVMSTLSSAIRQSRHLRNRPDDLLRLPAYLIISTLFLMPIRIYGFVRMAHASGWGTRSGGYAGERTLNPYAAIPYAVAAITLVLGTVLPG